MIFIYPSPGNNLEIFQPFLPTMVPVGVGYFSTHPRRPEAVILSYFMNNIRILE
ncbi:MAG: hypothetical protein AB1916_12400 [Thermodesulfobacteriota bacterium]